MSSSTARNNRTRHGTHILLNKKYKQKKELTWEPNRKLYRTITKNYDTHFLNDMGNKISMNVKREK
jgi:hypothetical protein